MIDKQIRIAVRLDKQLKEDFQNMCKERAINSSELVRQLIIKWMNEQLDNNNPHRRKTDIKD